MSKVFLVTDASWVANEVRAGLSIGEWDIVEISDPRLTTSLVREQHPEAVIVDMQVGSMGGMAIIRGIRGEVDEADLPRTVLLLDRSVDEFIARRAGADASVLKPINASALRAALDLGQTSSSEDTEEE